MLHADNDGYFRDFQIRDMTSPVECAHCGSLYDLGTVTVTTRYADCSVWITPCCRRTVDDRGETGWKSLKDYHKIEKRPRRWPS